MRQQDVLGMSRSVAVAGAGVEKAIEDEDVVDDEGAMVDEEILAGGSALTAVVEQPFAGESVEAAAVVVMGAVAVVAEFLSELAVCPLEAAVCPLGAAVCPLEAFVSR